MLYENYLRVLYLDLCAKKVRVEKREDLVPYLGGVGAAAKLFLENMRPELDPLDPSQPIILAIGAATFIYPVITKTAAVFCSPLTGEYGESYAGGRLGMAMFLVGYDAVVITGKADKPCYIAISQNNIEFKDARALWGLGDETGRIIREREPGGGKRSIIRIGPAGEKGIRYANVCVDTYRHFGRLGLGALFGSKNLKAVSVVGDRSLPIQNFREYFKVYQEIYKKVHETEVMSKYHDLGTSINIEPLNAAGGLPARNLSQGSFEFASNISGEAFAKDHLVRKMACTGCPVGCIHIGQFRREFDDGFEFESVSVAYDYELIFALGSYLGIQTAEDVLRLIEKVECLGMDAMSTGVVLGWTTEALAKGLISAKETLLPLTFGDTAGYLAAIENIVQGENEFYRVLGQGVEAAAAKYGGKDFAVSYAKNETSGYHTGYGSLIGPLVGARHSHLCNGGYSIDQSMKEFNKDKFVDMLFAEEKERCMLNSLIICLFARKVYDRPTILAALNAIGYNLTNQDLDQIGERIYKTKLQIKKALGFDLQKVTLPLRLFETPSMTGKLDPGTAHELMKMFLAKNEQMLGEGTSAAQGYCLKDDGTIKIYPPIFGG